MLTLSNLTTLEMIAARLAEYPVASLGNQAIEDDDKLSLCTKALVANTWTYMGTFHVFLPDNGRLGLGIRLKNQNDAARDFTTDFRIDGVSLISETESYPGNSVDSQGSSVLATLGLHEVQVWVRASSAAITQILHFYSQFAMSPA